MLENVMRAVNNFFEISNATDHATWVISEGSIVLPSLIPGQYFRIKGSVFNDGVWQYPCTDLTDETFEGDIIPLAVPKEFLVLVEQMEAWESKNGDIATSPYTNESFGGYSYTKAQGTGATVYGAFQKELRRWRKL